MGREELLREDAGQGLTRLDHLARGVDMELFDPPRDAGVHVRNPRFIGHDDGDGANRLGQ